MRILMVLLFGFASLMAAMPSRPEVPKRKTPVRQNTSTGAAAARAHAQMASGKAKTPKAAKNAKPNGSLMRPRVAQKSPPRRRVPGK